MTSISMSNRLPADAAAKQATWGDALRGALASWMEARTRAAERAVSAHLAGQGDGRLAGLGFSTKEIAAIRAGEPVNRILGR
ncbi:MAG TPA: hypothetical protein VJ740_13830 [Hyphomicrobiaceae bacterium]|nr:hypothetical protein [Hyphomicrobiaceae bacterium]